MVRNIIQQERKPLHLKEYDYHQNGAYFITICTQNRECRLGDVVNGRMRLNDCGRMVASIWQELPDYYPGIVLDSFVIMPNHVHGIIFINDVSVGAAPVAARFQQIIILGRHGGRPLRKNCHYQI